MCSKMCIIMYNNENTATYRKTILKINKKNSMPYDKLPRRHRNSHSEEYINERTSDVTGQRDAALTSQAGTANVMPL